MRDLKISNRNPGKNSRNRLKRKKKPLELRKLLHRLLRLGIALFSTILIVCGGFFAVQLLLDSDLFKVDQIIISGNDRLLPEQIIALSDVERGGNTLTLDLALIGRKIEENPWIMTADVRRILPHRIAIDIREREPIAIANLGYLYYLDTQGEIFKVLENGDQLDYPMVTGFEYEKARSHAENYARSLKRIVSLVADLRQRRYFNLNQVSEIHHETDGGLSLFTLESCVRIKLGHNHYEQKIDRLERIYAELKPKLKVLDYIDLNVDEKVIVRIDRPRTATKS